MSKTKKIVLAISLEVILACGVWAAVLMGMSEPTYDGSHMDLVDLYENNSNYDNSTADGAASIIVNENLEKTAADNVVFSVVFNFRGYDTLGESFILIAAIAGSLAILRVSTKKEHEKEDEQE
jgi:hypothetical protein